MDQCSIPGISGQLGRPHDPGIDLPAMPVFSVHMPSWYIPYREFTEDDVSDVLIPNWSKIAFSELLWAALSYSISRLGSSLICGGDFNTSEHIGGPRQNEANREVIRRMERLGLTEIVRTLNGGPVPTFKSRHQLDHLYVTSDLRNRVARAEVGSLETYSRFSDHLPLVVDLT
jgi:exodeoxyribonuclease-3